jgi:hypothetical protein
VSEQPKSIRASTRKSKTDEKQFDPDEVKIPKKIQLETACTSVKLALVMGFGLAMCRWASVAEAEQTIKYLMKTEDDLEKNTNAMAEFIIKHTHYKSVRKKAGRTESPLTTAVRLLVSQNKTYSGIVQETFTFTYPSRALTEGRLSKHARKVRDVLVKHAPELLPSSSGDNLKPLLNHVRNKKP